MTQLCTDEEFIAAWNETGGAIQQIAERFGFSSLSVVHNRRAAIEKKRSIQLHSASIRSNRNTQKSKDQRRIQLSLESGKILIGSDAHIWPGPLTTAQRAFIQLAKKLKPEIIVLNGDVFDGARISRHPPGIWDQEKRPTVVEEVEACREFTEAIRQASLNSQFIWCWGNHDSRYEYRLAAMAPEYQGVAGFALKDHFPGWQFCMALFVNDNLVIKHRFKGGRHAPENNTLWAGRSVVTGHLHSQKVQPVTDYNETRYGVDAGTMADPDARQFDYAEENPHGHRSGFTLLTIVNGHLLMPELVKVCDWEPDSVEFRGELIAA